MHEAQQTFAANPLQCFNFESHALRTFTGEDQIWFSATDICESLGLVNPSDVLKRLDGDEKAIDTLYTLGGEQQKLIVNESGLYSLILTSRKPAAKRFKRWVTHEVLPAIRNTGSFSNQPNLPLPTAHEIVALKDILGERFSLTFDPRTKGDYVTLRRMSHGEVMVDINDPERLDIFMDQVDVKYLPELIRKGMERVLKAPLEHWQFEKIRERLAASKS